MKLHIILLSGLCLVCSACSNKTPHIAQERVHQEEAETGIREWREFNVGMKKKDAIAIIRKYPHKPSNADDPADNNTNWICPSEQELASDDWRIYGPSSMIVGSVRIAEMKFQNGILEKVWVFTMQ